ncbi:MAG TPA: lysylphosphatidylglycerol synthase domain-containing protein, partial [Candidatus Angelobacter sp.]|nr:lysylphosphatidylglycerol synthase domain-containing protein [Candidatus Angelobacter sp.]
MRTTSPRRFLAAFRPWSSAVDDPRLRRPTDILLLLGSASVAAAIAFSLRDHPPTTAPPPATPSTIVDVVTYVAEASYLLVVVWAGVLVLLPVFSSGRRRLLLDYGLGTLLALLGGLAVSRPSGSWSDTLRTMLTTDPEPVDVVGSIAVATAIVVIASPHVTRPLRWLGRLLVLVGAVSAVLLDITHPLGGVAVVAVGIAAAALTHLVLGTPSGHPTADQVLLSLPDVGVEVDELVPARRQPVGASRFITTTDDERHLVVTVYGRDSWDDQLVGSVWTALTIRGESVDLFGGRRRRVEHEALVTLLAERAGVAVLPVVTAGLADSGDAVIVTEAPAGHLAGLDPAAILDTDLAAMWDALQRLHAAGIAHRGIDGWTVVQRTDGAWALTDLDDARLAADPGAVMIDRVRLLVATAVAAGHERAVAAAVAALGPAGIAEMLPYLQSAVLDRAARKAVGHKEWELDDLRTAAVAAAGVEPPPLLNVRRVTARSVGLVLLVGVVAYAIVGLLAGVDFASIRQELEDADKVWLWTALAMSPFVQAGFAFSTIGASMARLRYVPVLMLQYAIQFIALTLPSTAARLALSVRFFQRFGVPPGTAISMGVIDSFSGFVVQVVLLLVILLSGLPGLTTPIRGSSTETTSTSTSSSSPTLLGLLVVLIVVGILVTVLVPPLRRRMLGRIPLIRKTIREQLDTARSGLEVLRHPAKVTTMLLGNLAAQVMQALILGVCLYAFGETAHLSQLILINPGVSLFAGLMPVPGGMG